MRERVILILAFCFMTACSTTGKVTEQGSSTGRYDSSAIINELLTQAMQLDSYAQDYIVRGVPVKRMFFQFSKDGKPFYRFRSEYLRDGKRFVHLFNVDGNYDYDYYPDDAVAYRIHTKGDWNDSNYDKAKAWHFNYTGSQVIGEDLVNGKECFLLQKGKYIMSVWKKHGLQVDLRGHGGTLNYDNFELQVADDLFVLPSGVRVIDK